MPNILLTKLATIVTATCLMASSSQAQITIPTVPIGNPGNAADPFTGNLFGSVAYTYNIGKYEVTNAQYAAFLNAKAKSDPYALYNAQMAGVYGGITRSGSPGSYVYSTVPGRENNPVNYVSFWDACRFANWLHNGQGNGDTETGAYTLTSAGISANTVVRNADWLWAVTSEDEWYKAAYFQPTSAGGDADNYWLFPTSSNSVPSAAHANIDGVIGSLTPVGFYAPNFNGAFDMGGNVWEWNEAIILLGVSRGIRGGSFLDLASNLRCERPPQNPDPPVVEYLSIGFRVSQRVELPCRADFDGSDFVDSDDFTLFVFAFSRGCTAPRVPVPGCFDSADYDQSGFIDSDDYIAFVADFERGC